MTTLKLWEFHNFWSHIYGIKLFCNENLHDSLVVFFILSTKIDTIPVAAFIQLFCWENLDNNAEKYDASQ